MRGHGGPRATPRGAVQTERAGAVVPTAVALVAATLVVGMAVLAVGGAGCRRREPGGGAAPGAALKVAAASDLAFAFEEMGKAFEARTGQRPIFSFGSTGQLARQIAEGAPFDLFAAANVSFVDDVVKAGACEAASKARYARGRIAIWSRQPGVVPAARLEDLADARFAKIAIANPEHAPYGRAAKQALVQAGLWERVQSRIVYGENIQQTLQFARTGNVEAAVVALSLATVARDGHFCLVDDRLHRPLDQALVVCKRGANAAAARAFAELVASPAGRQIMEKHGFVLPGAGGE